MLKRPSRCCSHCYGIGVGVLHAEWNGLDLDWSGNLSRLVWLGQDGGAIRHMLCTTDGTVVFSVQENGQPCPTAKGEGCKTKFPSNVSLVHSLDGGRTFVGGAQLRIRVPPLCADQWCDQVSGHAPCYGAIEPATAQLASGVLLTLIRAQTGTLWAALTGPDGRAPDGSGGAVRAFPTPLVATDSPPFLLRLRSKRLLLIWVNVGTSAPLPCQSKLFGVWTPRPLLHAATSHDGKVWEGHREIYRDPLMAVTPSQNGD